jgi:hypothetical protein
VNIATEGTSESARVSAANALLDRGFGRPVQSHGVGDAQQVEHVVKIVDFREEDCE